jgi:uroporphyrinogen-III synthase
VRVLVTRGLDEARRTASELARRGHEALVAPLSEVRLLDSLEPDLSTVQAVLATSSNGVRAFARRCGRRDLPVWAVGATTAATARAAGFASVLSADGDSTRLAAVIRESVNPNAGSLLLLTGRRRTGELERALAQGGFACRTWELYDIVSSGELPKQVIAAFRQGRLDAVLVLSAESGRDLVRALKTANLGGDCGGVLACCISRAAATAIQEIQFGSIRIAESPRLDAVLALLEPGSVCTQ